MHLIDFYIDQLFCMDVPLNMISKDLGTIGYLFSFININI